MDLFAKDTKKTAAKKGTRVVVELENQESSFQKLVELNEQIAALEAEKKVIDAEVREESRDAMISYYNKKKSFPGTLQVVAGSMELQFITADKYKIIDEDRANELIDKYNEDLVDEETKYSFNTEVLQNNMKAINKMISKSKDISTSDKQNLIDQVTTWKIAKGTIKNLKNENFAGFDLEELIDDIKPIYSIKAIKKSE